MPNKERTSGRLFRRIVWKNLALRLPCVIVMVMKQRQPQNRPPNEKEVAVWREVELLGCPQTAWTSCVKLHLQSIRVVRLFRYAKPRSRLVVLIRSGGTNGRLIGQ